MATLVATLPECQVRHLAYATFSVLQVFYGREAYLVEYDSPPLILVRGGKVQELTATERVNRLLVRSARRGSPSKMTTIWLW